MFRCKKQQKQQGATDAGAVRPSPEEGAIPCANRTLWQIDAVLPIVEIPSRWSIRLSSGSSHNRVAHACKAGPNFWPRDSLAPHPANGVYALRTSEG